MGGETLPVLPPAAGLTFLADVAVPYVEAVFLRGTPFLGTVSFNAQAQQISPDRARFAYGALFADPLPTMGSGIPPSLLMQDMYRHLPEPSASVVPAVHPRGGGREGEDLSELPEVDVLRHQCGHRLAPSPIRSTPQMPSSKRPTGPTPPPGQGG